MGKLILFLLAALMAGLYFESSRAVIFDTVRPVLQPYFVMATTSEMEKIAQELQVFEKENFGRLPGRRSFPDWVDARYSAGGNVDSWGNVYEYTLARDSFHLRSLGPDRLRGTEDDILEARPRTGTGVIN